MTTRVQKIRAAIAALYEAIPIEELFKYQLRDAGGSSSPLTPGAGDATQAAKDGVPGTPSDSRPPDSSPFSGAIMEEIQGNRDLEHPEWMRGHRGH